jgi:hypothetical protein
MGNSEVGGIEDMNIAVFFVIPGKPESSGFKDILDSGPCAPEGMRRNNGYKVYGTAVR